MHDEYHTESVIASLLYYKHIRLLLLGPGSKYDPNNTANVDTGRKAASDITRIELLLDNTRG